MIWHRIAVFILSNRRAWIVGIVLATGVMGYLASQVKLSYELAKILPTTDPGYQQYEQFKARYGEDGNVLALGIETRTPDEMYQLRFFQDWYDLNQRLRRIKGIKDVLSNAGLYAVVRNDSTQKLGLKPLLDHRPTTQAEVDSVRARVARLPFFAGFVNDSSGRVHLMAATFDQKALNDKSRIEIVADIQAKADSFGLAHGMAVHLSGLPFIRTAFTEKVSRELVLFLGLAFLVSAVILFIFFRSGTVVLVASGVVLAGVLWSVGYMVLLGYEITLLTGLIPPLVIVIGIPNAIFLLNRYHEELGRHDPPTALRIATEKVGETTFFANITTSIGFGVFYFTASPLLLQFGLVAALGVMTTFALSLVLIPAVFSYLPAPTPAQRGHLDSRFITAFLAWVDTLVHQRRWLIYSCIGAVTVLGLIGMLRLKAIGHVVDDLPQNDPIFTDLKFFEKHFRGVLPFEVSIDTRRPGRVLDPTTLSKIRVLQREFGRVPDFTRPLSVAEAIKFFYQGFRGGDPKYYVLPGALELNRMAAFAPALQGSGARFNGFIDSTRRYTRISFQMPDAGTVRIQELVAALQPKADSIFNIDSETGNRVAANALYDVKLTGNSIVYAEGNAYLLQNLAESTLLAIGLVSLILVFLLRDLRLSLIAIVPSIIPLIVTAGIMGIVGIDLKPTTILVFSIAFGLSSDGTIYFITHYRDRLRHGMDMESAISNTIRRTGVSMFYTAIILFAGFAIFTASTFRGTIALGMLVSVTLLMGMASNLILLPAFLLSAAGKKGKQ
jgi:uncharacterized protein